MRPFYLVLFVACAGRTVDPPGSGSPSATETPSSMGGLASEKDGAPPPEVVCSTVGARRDAKVNETAQYCVCEMDLGYLLWRCYGPAPGASSPQTSCSQTFVNQGGGKGSCLVNWQACGDGKMYSVSCVDGACYCLVDGQFTTTIQAQSPCPEGKGEINALCGWRLE